MWDTPEIQLDCGHIISFATIRIEPLSVERTRKIVCPCGNEANFITKAGEFGLSVDRSGEQSIYSTINIPA